MHRDLKSHNVFLVDGEPEHHRVRLLDFGISKLLEPLGDGTGETALTTEGAILGTPHYLAPEQFDGSVDPRSDLYSLGVVMFEMLSGDLPFRAKSPVAVMMMHAKEPPPRPSVRRPDLEIPAAIESVVMKALSKAPDDRFSSAEAMSRALDEAVDYLQGALDADHQLAHAVVVPGHERLDHGGERRLAALVDHDLEEVERDLRDPRAEDLVQHVLLGGWPDLRRAEEQGELRLTFQDAVELAQLRQHLAVDALLEGEVQQGVGVNRRDRLFPHRHG